MNKYLKKVAKDCLRKFAVRKWAPWELKDGPKLGPVLKTKELHGSKYVSPADVLRNIYGSEWPDIKRRTTQYRQRNPNLFQKYFLGSLNPTNLARSLPIERHAFPNSWRYAPKAYDSKRFQPSTLMVPVKWINRRGISGNALRERLLWGEETGHARQFHPIQKWERIPTMFELEKKEREKGRQRPVLPISAVVRPPHKPDESWDETLRLKSGLTHMRGVREFSRKVAQIRQLYHMLTPDAQPIETPEDFRKAWEDMYEKVQSSPELKESLPASTFPLLHIHPRDVPKKTVDVILRLGPAVVKRPQRRKYT